MKKNLKFFAGALTTSIILGGAILASCTSEETDGLLTGSNVIGLAKAPNVVAYSGDMVFGNTFANKGIATRSVYANKNMWDQDWQCDKATITFTEEDIAAIKEMFELGKITYNKTIVPWPNYFVQQVYKGESTYVPTDISGDRCSTIVTGSNQMDKLVAYNENVTNKNYGGYNDPDNNWAWVEVITEDHYEHVDNFNYGNNTDVPSADGKEHVHTGTTLMTNMSLEGITPNNQFGFHESYGTSHNYNNYIIFQYKGEWYVGFDYEMHKDEAQNANEAKNVERDWNFTDWIVRISPAYPKNYDGEPYPDPYDPSNPGEQETPEEPTPGGTPEEIMPSFQNDVEVNLHGVEKVSGETDKYLESHLSIHVRYATDVEIFIPMDAMYYCDADDMAIVKKHLEDEYVYGGSETQNVVTYNIGGTEVELHIEFGATKNGENGIKIWTVGIDKNVIDYCRENYGDGITFEVWNYFNDPDKLEGAEGLTLEGLQACLNRATIEFLDDIPEYYVNAFYYSYDEEGERGTAENSNDCTVSVVDSQKGQFTDATDEFDGKWWNGSPYNEIYKKNSVKPEPPVY